MIVKFLGILDLVLAVGLLLASVLPAEVLMVFGLYLLVKGGFFLLTGDWMSVLDIGVAIYFMVAAFGVTSAVITAVATLFLIQKGGFSLLN